ncbi:MAG: hypothetical protein HC810_00065 [Acaryochloridaceae cyanobacterium RL_2_7]|nr:hypothetical protein [Acaryochloridaceae cyanobacterium RL_2_7]
MPSTLLRTIGFALAGGVMFLLSRQMRQFLPVASTLGLILIFVLNAVYSYALSNPEDWLWLSVPVCSMALGLVVIRLRKTPVALAVMYRRSADLWSYFLNLVLTGVVALLAGLSFIELESIRGSMQVGAVLVVIAVLFQLWLSPRVLLFYAAAVSLEASVILLSWLCPWPHEVMATATLVMGGVSMVSDRFQPRVSERHWMVIPLLFAGAAWLLGHYDFWAHTGLYTMGAALILLGVGRRAEYLRALTYLGIAGFSFGIYELLVYQILQAEGEHPGDALILFAGLTTLIMLGDRLLTKPLSRTLRLSSNQFLPVAHLHWLTASLFLATALVAPMSLWAEIAWMILLLILAIYAMVAGRIQTGFLYGGVAQILGAIAFGMAQIIPLSMLGYWGGAIAVGLRPVYTISPGLGMDLRGFQNNEWQ